MAATSTKQSLYITTTLPYVNGTPHVGHAMEFIRADTIARYKELMGCDVFFNTGTDEHGQKIYDAARQEGKDTQQYVDFFADQFKQSILKFNLSPAIHFIRTTDQRHKEAAQEMWRRCDQAGYIYKKNYQAKYCVGCELEKTDSELVNGRCPDHPSRELQRVDEENYFFKFSELGPKLLALYESRPHFVTPDFRYNEIKTFVENGLQDFSISRLRAKMPWGIPVPGDEEHVMYVWFDALTNYISTLDWPHEEEGGDFDKYWKKGTPIQYCGKDNLRQQSAMWQAMLIAAGLPTTDRIIINGFIISDGKKMSKSEGNVVDPYNLLDQYSLVTDFPEDVLRYYLLRHVHAFDDSDMTEARYHEAYTANLVNGLGNLTSRLMNMVVNYEVDYDPHTLHCEEEFSLCNDDRCRTYHAEMDNFRIDRATDIIWDRIQDIDEEIATKEPFKKFKTDPEGARNDLREMVNTFSQVVKQLQPLMPRTAQYLRQLLIEKRKPEKPLFARLES